MSTAPSQAIYRHIPIAGLSGDELLALSQRLKLSLSREDMLAVQAIFAEEKREPTDVELEVIAQTWSEHCKHRIFGARITHSIDGKTEIVEGLFKTYIKAVTEERQPGGYGLGGFGPAPEGMAAWIIGIVAAIGLALWIGARA